LIVWDDGGATRTSSVYGFSVSAGALEYMAPATAGHFFYTNGSGTCRFSILSGGTVGVNTAGPSASYALDVNGQCHASSFPTSSDIRFKKNIRPLVNSLEKVTQLSGVSYEWNEFVNSRREGYELNRRTIGLIAQDVEKVIPEIVDIWELSPDCTDARAVEYQRIVPYLIEAIKEQQGQITAMSARIAALESSSV
jgi:hypothetical protein